MSYEDQPKLRGGGVLLLAGMVLLVLFSFISFVSKNKDFVKEMLKPEQGAN